MKQKVYFAGAIRGGRDKVDDYKIMVERFEKNGCEVLTKHVADCGLTFRGENLSFEEIYERDLKWLRECDILFADITVHSVGVGYEICHAEKLGKPVYVAYDKKANVSGFLRGDRNLRFLPYGDVGEVVKMIDEITN